MKSIMEILANFGVEIPQEKSKDFEKEVVKNYKTIAEFDNVKTNYDNLKTDLQNRDTDLATLQSKLQSAGADETKLSELQSELEQQKQTYATDKTNYENQLKQQQYEFIVKEKTNGINFTSNSARESFVNKMLEKQLPLENDTLLGFDDFVNTYKERDVGAFATEEKTPLPIFSSKGGTVDVNDSNPFGFNFTRIR